MANTRIGQINGAGDELALFQDIFTGEVLAAYEQSTILDGLIMKKTISGGKSASFKNTSKLNGGRHIVGTVVSGENNFKVAETIVNIEDRTYVSESLAEIDELMNDFNARNAISKEMGIFLANQKDTDSIKEIIKGARATNVVTGLPGGTEIINADFASAVVATKASALRNGITEGVKSLKEKNVNGEVYVVLRPEEYYVLLEDDKVINSDYTNGNGGIDTGSVLMVAGAKILMSNNLVQEDSSVTDTYHGVDASNTFGIMFTKDAVAVVDLKGISTKYEEQTGGWATLVTSSYISGVKFLRPEACVELKSI